MTLRLVQYLDEEGQRRVGTPTADSQLLTQIADYTCVYDLALAALSQETKLSDLAEAMVTDVRDSYDRAIEERRVLPPLDHPQPERCTVSLTGLTHVGSASSRDTMHAGSAGETTTPTLEMFRIGLSGGRPEHGKPGAQPEWAYKGDGTCVVAPECPISLPDYACDGGEEAELAGLYVIDRNGTPWRVGFAIGNEFSDHVLEKENYLYLAHSKLRECSLGPELLVGSLPTIVTGSVKIRRAGETIWQSAFESGEANMCHSIANLEHHHFKYAQFRRPGDIHIHFFGANGLSFGAGIRPQPGDMFEIDVPIFGRPLRNMLQAAPEQGFVKVNAI